MSLAGCDWFCGEDEDCSDGITITGQIDLTMDETERVQVVVCRNGDCVEEELNLQEQRGFSERAQVWFSDVSQSTFGDPDVLTYFVHATLPRSFGDGPFRDGDTLDFRLTTGAAKEAKVTVAQELEYREREICGGSCTEALVTF